MYFHLLFIGNRTVIHWKAKLLVVIQKRTLSVSISSTAGSNNFFSYSGSSLSFQLKKCTLVKNKSATVCASYILKKTNCRGHRLACCHVCARWCLISVPEIEECSRNFIAFWKWPHGMIYCSEIIPGKNLAWRYFSQTNILCISVIKFDTC